MKKQKLLVSFNHLSKFLDVILDYVGCLNSCKCLKRGFLRQQRITSVKFDKDVSLRMVCKVLCNRTNLKCIDFTDSNLVDENTVHVIMILQPSIKTLILDNCDKLTDFPMLDNEKELWIPLLSKNGTFRWKDTKGPLISLKGCWKIYRRNHQQNPAIISVLIMRAIMDQSMFALFKIRSFCLHRRTWRDTFEDEIIDFLSSIDVLYWSIVKEEVREKNAIVMMDVTSSGFSSFLIWEFVMKKRYDRNVWHLCAMYKATIETMWLRCKIYASTL